MDFRRRLVGLAAVFVCAAATVAAEPRLVISTSNAADPLAEAEPQAMTPMRPMARPDTPRIHYDRAFLAGLPTASGDAQWRCLTEALYFEARGESTRGIFAVAEVILNRVDSRRFPGSICGVVNQGTGERYRCQFTYTCDGLAERVREPRAWTRVGKVARLMIDGAPRTLTEGATHYHTRAVDPNWSRVFARVSTIGEHHFYRMPG
jgi:spore germination cell wall hydrolase CwlJ-like protein